MNGSYTTEQVAKLLNIHIRTVQDWLKAGLRKNSAEKPYLIHWSNLVEFLKEKTQRRRVSCDVNELFCVRCKEARKPKNMQIFVRELSKNRVLLTGKCGTCDLQINRITSFQKFCASKHFFHILEKKEGRCTECPSLNDRTDLGRAGNDS